MVDSGMLPCFTCHITSMGAPDFFQTHMLDHVSKAVVSMYVFIYTTHIMYNYITITDIVLGPRSGGV